MTARWETARLVDIVTRLTNGYVGPTRDIYHESGVPYLLARHVKNNQLNFDDRTFISQEFNLKHKKSTLKKDDVLLVQSGHIGHSAVVTPEHEGHNCHAMIVITTVKGVISGKFLSLFFSSPIMQQQFAKIRSGSTVPHLTCKAVRELKIPMPKLPEQKHIVAILDEAFEDIATATANAEKNLQNARELFDSYLNSVFTERSERWSEATLQEVASDFGRGKSKHRPRNDKKLFGGNYPFIQTGDVRNSEHFIASYSQTYNDHGLAQSKLWPAGTVCITIAANIAETGILAFNACFPDSVIGVVADPEKAINEYVEYLLQFFKSMLQAKGQGAAQDNINLGTFKEQLFPFPELDEQRAIVEQLNSLAVECQQLESIYRQKLNDLAELKQSILQKAFSGELTQKAA